jgi:polysaccharide biosynthesis transport protein
MMSQAVPELSFDLRDLFGVMRRRAMSFALMFALILGPAILYLQIAEPRYSSTTLVQVDPDRNVLRESAEESRNSASISAMVDGEVEVIRSDRVLLTLIREERLIADSEFGLRPSRTDRIRDLIGLEMSPLPSGEAALNRVLRQVRSAVQVRRRGGTYLIEISVSSKDPATAARLANAIAAIHTRIQVQEKVRRVTFARDTIAARIEESREAMEGTETRLSDFFLTATDLTIAETGRADLRMMRDMITTSADRLSEAERRASLLTEIASTGRIGPDQDALADEALRVLISEREALQSRNLALAPDAEEIEARIAALDGEIRDRANVSLGTVRREIGEARSLRERAEGDLRSALLGGEVPPRVLSGLFELQQESEIARNQHMSLLSRLRQLESMADLQVPDVRVVSDASPNFTPSSPRSRLILLIGFAVSLLAGLLFALLREFQIGGFTSVEQVANTIRTGEVVGVPRVGGSSPEVARLISDEPLGPYAEAIRRLRYGVQRLLSAPAETAQPASAREARRVSAVKVPEQVLGRVVCVTSSSQNEGKTTIAVSLARAFADAGVKTVLLDLDLRNPSVSEVTGSSPNDLLMRVLTGDMEETGLITDQDGSCLDLIPGGDRARVPTDTLLTSPRFTALIELLREKYELVLIDTPPVLPVIDPLLIVRHADLVVMPIRFGRTSQSAVRRTVSRISAELRPGARLVPVLNMEHGGADSYYRGYYG